MKIIGETGIGFIIEAHQDEIARLIGFYSHYSKGVPKLEIGTEIKVSDMYDQLYKVASIKSQVKAITDASSELVESVRTKMPIIEPVVKAIKDAMPKEQ